MTFPPPDPNEQIETTIMPLSAPAGGSSRRTASIVALTSGLLVGGVLVGSQFVSANTPSVADDPATPSTEVADTETPDDNESARDHSEWMDLGGIFGLDPEVEAQFEEFGTCIAEQLGDGDLFGGFDVLGEEVFGDDGILPSFEDFDFGRPGDFEIPAGVFVEAGDDTGFYEFGDGDGTITITKSGDDISVSTDGDVDAKTFELPDFGKDGEFPFPEITAEQQADLDAKWADIEAKWEAADTACGDLLPDDVLDGMLDGVFSSELFDFPTED